MKCEAAFNVKKYITAQNKKVKERVKKNRNLFIEIGGFISQDLHASRVLPGYAPNTKLLILKSLKDADFVYCVNSKDIESNRKRMKGEGELLEDFVINDLETITSIGIKKPHIALTMYENESRIATFQNRLHQLGYKSNTYNLLSSYPNNIKEVLSPGGFGSYHKIEKKSNMTVILGAGGNSGKMAMAISQIYLNKLEGRDSFFTKLETFPVWNIPLNHPVNIAYEFATANHGDDNSIDLLYKEKTGINAVTYNRDIKNFEILRLLLEEIFGKKIFHSPTEMCINMISAGFENDNTIRAAAENEITRRYKFFKMNPKMNPKGITDFERCNELIKKYNLVLK
ncbi:DUF1846 family protein [bacterium]|nr:DUF1846 family protein [bacterium]